MSSDDPELRRAGMSAERDMVGYGRTPPDPQWPGGAAIAVQFVLNDEQ